MFQLNSLLSALSYTTYTTTITTITTCSVFLSAYNHFASHICFLFFSYDYSLLCTQPFCKHYTSSLQLQTATLHKADWITADFITLYNGIQIYKKKIKFEINKFSHFQQQQQNCPLQLFGQDYGLASHTTHAVCLNFYTWVVGPIV